MPVGYHWEYNLVFGPHVATLTVSETETCKSVCLLPADCHWTNWKEMHEHQKWAVWKYPWTSAPGPSTQQCCEMATETDDSSNDAQPVKGTFQKSNKHGSSVMTSMQDNIASYCHIAALTDTLRKRGNSETECRASSLSCDS